MFTLVCLSNGKFILAADDDLPEAQRHDLRTAFRKWLTGDKVVILPATRVIVQGASNTEDAGDSCH
jgi:hypothetical protein